METVNQWGSGLLIVGGALLCGLLILVGGVIVAVLRTGIVGDLLAGLGGAVGAYEDTPEASSRRIPRTGSARSRARALREQADREFYNQVGEEGEPPDRGNDRVELGAVERSVRPRDTFDAASRARSRRRRSEVDDFEDELDAFLDDTEL